MKTFWTIENSRDVPRHLVWMGLVLAGMLLTAAYTAPEPAETPTTDWVTVHHELNQGIAEALLPSVLTLADIEADRAEWLWLARCIFSETKRPDEQALVAWVVRNRVETQYRNQRSYHAVVLDPYQFSAFNADSPKRDFYVNLDERSTIAGWPTALQIARMVMAAPSMERPFSLTTRHFYSERSMPGATKPVWAQNLDPIALIDESIDLERFRFYEDIG